VSRNCKQWRRGFSGSQGVHGTLAVEEEEENNNKKKIKTPP
jgi:hypothetical protein